MKQTIPSASSVRLRSVWLVTGLLAGLLAGSVRAQQPTSPQKLTSYAAADQTRFRAGAVVPAAPAGGPRPGARVLRPGAVVFGWLPAWLPAGYGQQVDFALLSHVACEGYQATEQGGLQAPVPGPTSTLAATVHQANPRCRVLVSVGYQEPAASTSVFGAAGAPMQQALAQQVKTLGADGVNLDLTFRPLAVGPPPPAKPATKGELKRNERRLDKTRIRLNKQKPIVAQDSLDLVKAKQAIDALSKQNQPIPDKQQREYDHRLEEQQKAAAKLRRDLAAYRKALAAHKQGLLLPDAAPPTDERPAAVARFVQALGQALHQQNPAATLTLSVPAVDSARVYGSLPTLAPLVQLFVLKAFDYTAGRRGVPGPLAPLQPTATYGPYAVATSVSYYLGQGIPAAKLLVGLPSMGKLWTKPSSPLDSTRVAPYQYLSNRSLLDWPRVGSAPDPVTGSRLVQLRPSPDSARSRHAQPTLVAWADDSASLAAHYAWVQRQQLGGVGIWALGFDAPDAPIWNLIRANFAQPAPKVAAESARVAWTPVGAVRKAETWLKLSPLAHVLLFGLALLLAGAWVGLLLGAVARVRRWVPFPHRLALVSGLLLLGAALLGLYACLLGQFSTRQLLVGWLTPLGLVGLLGASYLVSRPRELP